MGMIQEQRTECPEQITSSAASFQYINHISFLYLFFHLFVLLSIFYAHATLLFSSHTCTSSNRFHHLGCLVPQPSSYFILVVPGNCKYFQLPISSEIPFSVDLGSWAPLNFQWLFENTTMEEGFTLKISSAAFCPEGWLFSSKLLRVQAWSRAYCSPACADFSKLSHI